MIENSAVGCGSARGSKSREGDVYKRGDSEEETNEDSNERQASYRDRDDDRAPLVTVHLSSRGSLPYITVRHVTDVTARKQNHLDQELHQHINLNLFLTIPVHAMYHVLIW